MMLVGSAVLHDAASEHRAVPGFVAYNLETAQGIVAAAERSGLPVLLQAGSSAFRHAGLRPLATLALELARRSPAPVGVHLDHSRDLEEITACLSLGYTSVMIDGSRLAYAENVALTKSVVARAHDAGAWVEAELGAVSGDEDVSTDARAGAMTDPQQAGEFVAATGVDTLAVAVGNVHGLSASPPEIDLDRLAAIRRTAGVPLVLHGASGLADDVLLACLDRGVAKVNVNTELRVAFLAAISASLPAAGDGADLVAVLAAGREAVTARALAVTTTLARAPESAEPNYAQGNKIP
jgi:tagatose 1,6-diphosphate aldolase GatY/KbaY